MNFTKFPSIESFAHVRKTVTRTHEFTGNPIKPVEYYAKVKLHGTNAAIRYSDGEFYTQKRSSDCQVGNDNAGFAAWFETVKPLFVENHEILKEKVGQRPYVIYGEWAGPGVQKGDAVSLIEKKTFFPFAVNLNGNMINLPGSIDLFVPDTDTIRTVPVHSIFTFDFMNVPDETVDAINRLVEGIGESDPYIKREFGIDGAGEGLVFAPSDVMPVENWARLTFKAKAERHRVKKGKTAVTQKLAIPANILDFVETFVTEARLEQGVSETGVEFSPENIPVFLKWFGSDVKKESVAELEEMGLEWKNVSGVVNSAAVKWFKSKISAM